MPAQYGIPGPQGAAGADAKVNFAKLLDLATSDVAVRLVRDENGHNLVISIPMNPDRITKMAEVFGKASAHNSLT